MLTKQEFKQLLVAIVSTSSTRINGRDHVDVQRVLSLLSTFCDEQCKLTFTVQPDGTTVNATFGVDVDKPERTPA